MKLGHIVRKAALCPFGASSSRMELAELGLEVENPHRDAHRWPRVCGRRCGRGGTKGACGVYTKLLCCGTRRAGRLIACLALASVHAGEHLQRQVNLRHLRCDKVLVGHLSAQGHGHQLIHAVRKGAGCALCALAMHVELAHPSLGKRLRRRWCHKLRLGTGNWCWSGHHLLRQDVCRLPAAKL